MTASFNFEREHVFISYSVYLKRISYAHNDELRQAFQPIQKNKEIMIFIINDQVVLEQTAFKHAAGLFSAIDRKPGAP